jgi:hypothetical protein
MNQKDTDALLINEYDDIQDIASEMLEAAGASIPDTDEQDEYSTDINLLTIELVEDELIKESV